MWEFEVRDQQRIKAVDSAGPKASATQPLLQALDRPLVLAVLVAVATLAVYFRAILFGFVDLDDPVYASGNTHVLTGFTFQNVKWSFSRFHDANWIPLTWLSLMLDAEIFGERAAGFHFTNVLLHIINTLLLLAVLKQATGSPGKSAFVAALFALHPLHVESVAWVSERKDALSIFFGMLALWAYVDYAQKARWQSWLAAFLFFICSLMAKQTLVTLPFVFLLLDYWPLQRLAARHTGKPDPSDSQTAPGPKVRWLIFEKAPFFAASLGFSVIAIFAQRQAIGTLKLFPFSARCENAVVAYVDYLRQSILPYGLTVFYPYPNSNPVLAATCATLFLLAISAVAVICIRKLPFLFVGWAWYLGTLVPMIGLVQVGAQRMADRYTYFPLIGVFLAVAWLAPRLVPDGFARARLLPAAGLTCLGLLTAMTVVQIGYWADSVTLYLRALQFAPNDAFLMSSYGFALASEGETVEGLRLLETACHLPPPSSKRHFALAFALQKLGRTDEAAAEYEATLALDSTDAEAHSNLAVIQSAKRQYEEARNHLLRAIEVDPDYVISYVNLGVVSMALRRYGDAIIYSQRALELDPSITGCHTTIALALRAQGRFDEAINRFRYVIQVSPSDEQARLELEWTLEMKRQASGA